MIGFILILTSADEASASASASAVRNARKESSLIESGEFNIRAFNQFPPKIGKIATYTN